MQSHTHVQSVLLHPGLVTLLYENLIHENQWRRLRGVLLQLYRGE